MDDNTRKILLNLAAAWQKQANRGDPEGQLHMGLAYLGGGPDIPQNYEKARDQLQKAAAQGHAGAHFVLGDIYSYGQGVAKDLEMARNWYQKAADLGFPGALQALKRLDPEGS